MLCRQCFPVVRIPLCSNTPKIGFGRPWRSGAAWQQPLAAVAPSASHLLILRIIGILCKAMLVHLSTTAWRLPEQPLLSTVQVGLQMLAGHVPC